MIFFLIVSSHSLVYIYIFKKGYVICSSVSIPEIG